MKRDPVAIAGCIAMGIAALVIAGPALARYAVTPSWASRPSLALDNLGHMRLLGIEAAVIAAGLLIRRRRLRWAAALLLAWSAWGVVAYSLPEPRTMREGKSIRIASVNLGMGTNEGARFEEINRWLDTTDPDVIVFNELDDSAHRALKASLARFPSMTWDKSFITFGTAVFSKFPIADSEAVKGLNAIRVELDSPAITLWACHLPAPHLNMMRDIRDTMLMRLAERIRGASGPVVVAGDLNSSERASGFRSLHEAGMKDSRQGFGWQPSWPARWYGVVLGTSIDHILVNDRTEVLGRGVGPAYGSDHHPIWADMTVTSDNI